MKNVIAILHDKSVINIEIDGSGPAVLLPVNPTPLEGSEAEVKKQWGMDPALGRNLVDGLKDKFTVVAFDYEGHRMAHPAPDTLTPDAITHDFLAVADAAGVEKFAYYGYSWLSLSGLQLGIRTDRLWALIMGAYPPVDGPYKEMWAVTKATHELALHPEKHESDKDPDNKWDNAEFTISAEQTKQFFTLYNNLQDFNDRAVQAKLTCPRLCFAGSKDIQEYSERWGGATVDMATPLIKNEVDLKAYGWDVKVLDGLDHMSGMQPVNVLPVIRPWLISKKI